MYSLSPKEKARLRPLVILSLTLVLIIAATLIVRSYFGKVIAEKWQSISVEKSNQIKDDCLKLFDKYQSGTSAFSTEVLSNKKLINYLSSQNARKSYESLLESEGINDHNVEIYNSRLELFIFTGRQLNPDILELKRAASGEKFSLVKEIGFYSYLIVYEPIRVDSLTSSNKTVSSNWVLVSAKLLDIKYEIQNKFFSDFGITREISRKYKADVIFDFSRFNAGGQYADTTAYKDKLRFDIKNIRGQVIGKLLLPQLEKSSYLLDVEGKFSTALAIEIFLLNIFLAALLIFFVVKIPSLLLRAVSFALVLVGSRYLWILVEFPSRLFGELGYEMFSPSYFASGFAFGVGKSVGDLLITSIIVLVIATYSARLTIEYFRKEVDGEDRLLNGLLLVLTVVGATVALSLYGSIVQGLIYESTLRFIDRSQILTTSQPELIYANLFLLLLSVSLVLVISVCALISSKLLQPYLLKNTLLRRNSVLLFFAALIMLTVLLELFAPLVGEFPLKLNFRILIYALSGGFAYYVYRRLIVTKTYKFVNLLNISLLLLATVIFLPALLLNKITSQENKYIERFARDVSEQSDDKINFLITTSLEDASENPELESDLKDKNKYSRLAFNIWTQSKFYNEDINSGVFVLDTAKKLISDFNTNPAELLPDSVISFALQSIKPKVIPKPNPKSTAISDSTADEDEDINLAGDQSDQDNLEVLQNKEMKFYCAIRPIEKVNLINSKFSKVQGYIIVAAQYDAKNFLTQSGGSIFRSFARDNITNKLTSQPVISEFSDGELVGSSNKEVSKALIKSLDAFTESVKDKHDKSALRYDEFESDLYKSYYYMAPAQGGSSPERIYVVSVRVNDFGLYSFYILRFLLFTVMVYLVFVVLYVIYRLFVYMLNAERKFAIRFRFREKLFVSFVLVSVIPIVVLATYSRELAKEKNNDFYKNQIISDLRIMEQYIKTKAPYLSAALPKPNADAKQENLADVFGKGFSESDKNFNLYVKAKLAATTNEQLYKSDLLDIRISGNAYYNIALQKKDYYQENQEIGNYKFIVGYKPLYDKFNNLVGILSTQTVFKQSDINEELTESLVFIFGPYIIAVILLIAIVNYISYRISSPIVRLQKATEQLSRGNIDIQVKSSTGDEIGELISSFNRMTRELKRSRSELKKAERETAWRDIARQIAHEIKNPLTPMKLAMQHLFYAYTHGANDFKSIIQTTNRLIIDQIESLNAIATEFSDFAKMPSRNYEPLNPEELLKDVVELLNRDGKVTLEFKTPIGDSRILGDRDEVKRAFINIIRNSRQAIDDKIAEGKDGHVNISAIKASGFYTVKVKDNGVGMDEQTQLLLFEPYFSTKSSGMGLGLVITKKIFDDMQAKIKVSSAVDVGTEVEIEFKLESKG